jgi:diguanylate cyclase (GGDEF)-like protein
VLNSKRIFDEATAGLNVSGATLEQYSWTSVVVPDTNIIELTVEGRSPQTAALLANNIGQSAIAYIEGLYPVYSLRLLDAAQPENTPISPQPLRDALTALALGLALGAGLALVRELLRAPIDNFLQQSNLDSMSQALNRKAFEKRFTQAAHGASELSLCLVQLDGLEQYEKVLPQPALQKILRGVTQNLQNQLRGNDLIGRWNDSEFAVLLSGTPGAAAVNTMRRVQDVLSAPIHTEVSDEALELKPVIGIAGFQAGKAPDVLVRQAELALKSATNNGRGISLSD